MHQALESAWASIAPQFTDTRAVEAARLKLAECVLGATRDGMTDNARARGRLGQAN